MSAVIQNYVARLEERLAKAQKRLAEVGVCPRCLEIPLHEVDAPFSSCRCGTGEDGARAPLQRLQILERQAAAPEWDGEGYPPEGAECEAYVLAETKGQGRSLTAWRSGVCEGKAKAPNGGMSGIFKDAHGTRHIIHAETHFRPIRSEEE